MSRHVLPETNIHPAIRESVAKYRRDLIEEVQAAIAAYPVVVVGMGLNPFPRKARQMLDQIGMPYHYLGYGNYFSEWRPRTALKMWSGWPTFPMIFVKGTLIGGASDLQRLIKSGELARMVA